jgi:hypothetical protein
MQTCPDGQGHDEWFMCSAKPHNSEFAIIQTTFSFAHYDLDDHMRQNVVKEQYKRGTQTKTSSFFKPAFK